MKLGPPYTAHADLYTRLLGPQGRQAALYAALEENLEVVTHPAHFTEDSQRARASCNRLDSDIYVGPLSVLIFISPLHKRAHLDVD